MTCSKLTSHRYSALEKSGKADQLGASVDLATVQAFNDQEIKDAILELNRSTDAINKQTETLKHQQDALARLVKGTAKDVDARSALDLKHAQASELDRKAAMSSVSSLAQSLELRLSELEQQGSGNVDAVHQTVNAMLTSDDKLLKSLQKLGWELETEDPEEKENVEKLRDICARLIKYTVEAIRTRLDRFYLETLETASQESGRGRIQGEDIATVQEELESLYSEILPVAQMSVEQQYLEPALKGLSAKNGKSLAKSARAVDYVRPSPLVFTTVSNISQIHDCLECLLEKTEKFCSRIEAFHAHQAASSQLGAIAKTELATEVEPPRTKERRPTVGASPTRRGAGAMSPVRSRGAATSKHRRQSSSIGMLNDEPPLEQLLRMLAITLPSDDDVSASALPNSHAKTLATVLSDRTAKVTDVAANVQDSFEAATTAQLKDSALALQALRDSLLAESPFGQVQLVDPEMDGSIRILDQELENVRTRLEKIDAEMTLIRGRRGKQDELIRRWGS
jgi:hypothetical protein